MDKYKLSIIIPHFNIPDLLQVLLRSIPVRDDIQIIVVDDNSTRKTKELNEIVGKQNERHFEFYKNYTMKNSLGTCRNIGLEHAMGKWIVFADADDYYTSGWLEELESFMDSDNDMIFFSATSVRLDSGETDTRHQMYAERISKFIKTPSASNELLLRFDFASACLKMYRRSFLNENEIRFHDIVTAEDTLFSLECGFKARKIACTDYPVYCITRRFGSLTTIRSEEFDDLRIQVRIKRAGYLYRSLSDDELVLLEMEHVGLQILYSALADRMGICKTMNYYSLLKKESVPIINWKHMNPIVISQKLLKSINQRYKLSKGDYYWRRTH